MRPLGTWVVIGAVALLGLFAARDALRGDEGPASTQTHGFGRPPQAPPELTRAPALPGRGELTRRLEALGARGVLEVTVGACVHFILRLPGLEWATPRGLPGGDCGFGATRVVSERSGLAAGQIDFETIEVTSEIWSYRFSGSSPAFKPGGTLTFVRDGRLYEWTTACAEDAATVTFRGLRAISRCVRRMRGAPRLLQEVVWTAEDEFAAIAGPQSIMSLLVNRDGRETSLFHSVGASLRGVVASSHGRYLAARIGGDLNLFDSRRPGNLELPSGAERSTAVAWSPDERYTALASESIVYVYPSGRPRHAVALPLSAVQLGWR